MSHHKTACDPHGDHASCLCITSESARCVPSGSDQCCYRTVDFPKLPPKVLLESCLAGNSSYKHCYLMVCICVCGKYQCFGATCCLYFSVGGYQTTRHHIPHTICYSNCSEDLTMSPSQTAVLRSSLSVWT
jgi:hypothetical protein